MTDLIIPSSLTSPLDVVNAMLRSIAEAPVNTLDPPPNADAEKALGFVNDEDLALQSSGWSWNSELGITLALSPDGTVSLPDQTLSCSQTAFLGSAPIQVQARGTKLYDRTNRRYTFTTAPKVDLVVRTNWDLLPQAARRVIALRAAQSWVAAESERSGVQTDLGQKLLNALATLEQQEDEANPVSTVQTVLQGYLNAPGQGSPPRRRGGGAGGGFGGSFGG